MPPPRHEHKILHALADHLHIAGHHTKSAAQVVKAKGAGVATHLHEDAAVAKLFLTDSEFRGEKMDKLSAVAHKNGALIKAEVGESEEMTQLLWKYAHPPHELTAEEIEKVEDQLKDIAKGVPALAIFLLPGGGLILPLLAMVLPFSLLPTSFLEAEEEQVLAKEHEELLLRAASSMSLLDQAVLEDVGDVAATPAGAQDPLEQADAAFGLAALTAPKKPEAGA